MTKNELIKRVISNEFSDIESMTFDHAHINIISEHGYLFEKYFNYSSNYEGSEAYFNLYSCLTGIIQDIITRDANS